MSYGPFSYRERLYPKLLLQCSTHLNDFLWFALSLVSRRGLWSILITNSPSLRKAHCRSWSRSRTYHMNMNFIANLCSTFIWLETGIWVRDTNSLTVYLPQFIPPPWYIYYNATWMVLEYRPMYEWDLYVSVLEWVRCLQGLYMHTCTHLLIIFLFKSVTLNTYFARNRVLIPFSTWIHISRATTLVKIRIWPCRQWAIISLWIYFWQEERCPKAPQHCPFHAWLTMKSLSIVLSIALCCYM